jgi:hypothetical protein
MKHMMRTVIVSSFFVFLATGACWGQPKAGAASIDPQAEKIMQALNAQKKKDVSASLEIIDTMDEVNEAGQKIQYSHVRKLVISEPKRFWIESTGDITNTTIWKDDAAFTLLDRSANVYAQAPAPGTIDETMDMLLDAYGVTTPLADLLSNDLYDVLMKNVTSCRYLGKHSVDGIPCHHIAAMQKNIDWQIWIDAGNTPQLCKIVITYKQKPGAPQYTAVLKSFNEVSQLPHDTFTFKPPEGAKKIPFLPVKKPAKKASAKQQ